MEFRIADTFTDSLSRLTGDEQKAAKTTAFDLQLNPGKVRQDPIMMGIWEGCNEPLAELVNKGERRDIVAHDLRRTAASVMVGELLHVERFIVGCILNHVERGSTKASDRHSHDKEELQALDARGSRLAVIVSGLKLVGRSAHGP
jgi:hypothetical protein